MASGGQRDHPDGNGRPRHPSCPSRMEAGDEEHLAIQLGWFRHPGCAFRCPYAPHDQLQHIRRPDPEMIIRAAAGDYG